MWNLEKVTAKNILSFEELSFDFKLQKALPIVGQNLDDEGQESNGSGKSSLFEIVSMCITGDSMKNVRAKENIRNGEDNGFSSLTLINKSINATLSIERNFSRKKTNTVDVLYNGERPKIKTSDSGGLDSIEANKFIFETIGMSRDDLYNYYLISSSNFLSFLKSSDTKKKEIIGRFSNASIVDVAITNVEENYIEKIRNEQSLLNEQIISISSKVEVYETQLEELDENEFEELKKRAIEGFESNIKNCKAICTQRTLENEKLEKINIELTEAVSSLLINRNKENTNQEHKKVDLNLASHEKEKLTKKYNDDKIKLLETKTSKQKNELSVFQTNLKEQKQELVGYESALSEINKILSGEIQCPKCNHKFVLDDGEINITEVENDKKEIELEIGKTEKLIEDLKTQIDLKEKEIESIKKQVEIELQLSYKSISEAIDKINNIDLQIKTIESNLRQYKQQIDSKNNEGEVNKQQIVKNNLTIKNQNEQIVNYKTLIEAEQKKKLDDKRNDIQTKIDDLNESLLLQVEKNDTLIEEVEVYTNWILNFKSFKTHLANNSIKTIETYANFYLHKMKSNIRLQIDGYKQLASGEVREQISCTVLRNGIEEGSYGKFSAGERSRIDIAITAALQSIINSTSKNGGLDMLFMDEILDAVDTLGLKSIIASLQNLGITIMVVTQNTIDQLGEEAIIIQKQNYKSTIL